MRSIAHIKGNIALILHRCVRSSPCNVPFCLPEIFAFFFASKCYVFCTIPINPSAEG